MTHVPLREVLPEEYLPAEAELRRSAAELEGHRGAEWHWYPEHSHQPMKPSARGVYLLLVDTSIMVFESRDDWLELTLDVAWRDSSVLTVNAAVEVGCWCPRDHNMHAVRHLRWDVTDAVELAEAFAAGAAMLRSVLDAGPYHPSPWRLGAGLPDAGGTGRP